MVRVPRRLFRSLQLLMLFQLLGGPLMVASIVMMAKLARHESVSLATLPNQIWRATDQAQRWQNGLDAMANPAPSAANTDPARRPATPTKPVKTSGSGELDKMTGELFPAVPLPMERLLPLPAQPPWRAARPQSLAQAPPSPPPRAA